MSDLQLFRDNIATGNYYHDTIKYTLMDIYDAMKECYGPYGSHITIDAQKTGPYSTKDGKQILSSIRLSGSISNAIHKAINDVADKQVEEVGDGSTTTILLLCKLYNNFRELMESTNTTPTRFKEALLSVVDSISRELKKRAEPIVTDGVTDFEKLRNAVITTVDGNNKLCDKVMSLLQELNCEDPLIITERSDTTETYYQLVQGVEITGQIMNSSVFFNGYSRWNYERPQVLVVNGRFEMKAERYHELCMQRARENRDLIILASGASESLMSTVYQLAQTSPGLFSRCPIFQINYTKSNAEFADLCASLGATSVDSETIEHWNDLKTIEQRLEINAGSCEKAELTEFCARFNEPHPKTDAVNMILDDIEKKIADLKKDPTMYNTTIMELEGRKAFLSRHYAKFYVGGESPQRKSINLELADDAFPQAISCMKHGIVPGCNTIVPAIIEDLISSVNEDSLENKIYAAIYDSYADLFICLIANRDGINDAVNIFDEHIKKNGFVPLNLRDGDTSFVCNSADTDRAILKYATDMALLLCTSRGFLTISPEFDISFKDFYKMDKVDG